MKIVMTLLVRDEEDILRENIDFHLNQGVDFIIATDNLSVDATRDILREYERKGRLHYIYEANDNYNQREWVTKMARLAFSEYDATWVINNDADEFWWPKVGTLKDTFLLLPTSANVISAQRKNFVFLQDNNNLPFYQSMIYKEVYSCNSLGKPLPPKVAHIAHNEVMVEQGNHNVKGIGEQRAVEDIIEILHFPIRNQQQFLNKIMKGGAAYSRNKELPQSVGRTWRELFNEYKDDGNLDSYLQIQSYDKKRLNAELLSGKILRDERLMNFLNDMYGISPCS